MMLLLAQISQAVEPSHIVLDGTVLVLIVTNMGLIGKAVADAIGKHKTKKVDKEKLDLCAQHEARIMTLEATAVPGKEGKFASLETNQANLLRLMETYRKENREDHEKIFDILRNGTRRL